MNHHDREFFYKSDFRGNITEELGCEDFSQVRQSRDNLFIAKNADEIVADANH